MKKKHLIRNLIAGWMLVLMMVSAFSTVAKADAPYKTYTVDGYGYVMETQTAYLPYETMTKIGDEELLEPTDFTILDDGYIYILDSGNGRIVISWCC